MSSGGGGRGEGYPTTEYAWDGAGGSWAGDGEGEWGRDRDVGEGEGGGGSLVTLFLVVCPPLPPLYCRTLVFFTSLFPFSHKHGVVILSLFWMTDMVCASRSWSSCTRRKF